MCVCVCVHNDDDDDDDDKMVAGAGVCHAGKMVLFDKALRIT